MSRVCILTDSTAQFPSPAFLGYELVSVIPLRVQLGQVTETNHHELKTSALPGSLGDGLRPRLHLPTPEEFCQTFASLGQRYQEIVAILISSQLTPLVAHAHEAAALAKSGALLHVIDSQTTSVGLGLLVQAAAEAARRGLPGARISRLVRSLVPRIYTVFCVQSLTYLAASGHLDPAQAAIGEMLGITPFLTLENGRLVPIQKVRSSRHLVDLLYEFITEFELVQHVAFLQGVPPFEQETHNLRERLDGNLSVATISEHTLGIALASIIGPHSLGVVVMENYGGELT